MKKFTVFTLILTIIVVIVASEVSVNNYLPNFGGEDESFALDLPESLDLSKSISTNVFGGDLELGAEPSAVDVDTISAGDPVATGESTTVLAEPIDINFGTVGKDAIEAETVLPNGSTTIPIQKESSGTAAIVKSVTANSTPKAVSSSGVADFEDASYVTVSTNVYLREDMLKSAGFVNAYVEPEESDGKLYKTIAIGDLFDVEVEKSVIRTKDALLAKVYIFKMGLNADVNEVYQLLKMRANDAPSSDMNETNEFGSGSFYMNDSSRSATAFLTARIGSVIYSFSYPKDYHSQVKNLIMLLEWELG